MSVVSGDVTSACTMISVSESEGPELFQDFVNID
jgi:hypothetical protein